MEPHDHVDINPFVRLRIATDASRREVVERSQELIGEADSQELRLAYRKAVEQIITKPLDRLIWAAWEMPDTDYDDFAEGWQRFVRAFRVNPLTTRYTDQLVVAFIEQQFTPETLLNLLTPGAAPDQPPAADLPDFSSIPGPDHPLDSAHLF